MCYDVHPPFPFLCFVAEGMFNNEDHCERCTKRLYSHHGSYPNCCGTPLGGYYDPDNEVCCTSGGTVERDCTLCIQHTCFIMPCSPVMWINWIFCSRCQRERHGCEEPEVRIVRRQNCEIIRYHYYGRDLHRRVPSPPSPPPPPPSPPSPSPPSPPLPPPAPPEAPEDPSTPAAAATITTAGAS